MRDHIDNRKLDQLPCQKLQRPPRPTFRRLSARHRDQLRFTSAIELSPSRRISRRLSVERPLEPFFDESLPDVSNRVRAHPERFRRLLVGPVGTIRVDFQQPCARAIFRALARPFDTNALSPFLSSSVRRTMYLFTIHTPSRPYGRPHPIPTQLAFSSWMRH